MKVEQKENVIQNTATIFVADMDGTPISDAHVLLVAENSTFFEDHTDNKGSSTFKSLPRKVYSIYIAHHFYPAHAIDNYTPSNDLNIFIKKIDDIGSMICADGTGHIQGLDGRLNPILDSSNRTYLYADNISIDGGKNQPVTFEIGKPLVLEDRNDVVMILDFLRIKGRSSLIQYRRISIEDKKEVSHEGFIKGLIIEAGGNIKNSGSILAHKDQSVILKAAKDVDFSGKIKFFGDQSDRTFFERITNNQTFAIIFGTLVLLVIVYLVYRYSGINLSEFK